MFGTITTFGVIKFILKAFLALFVIVNVFMQGKPAIAIVLAVIDFIKSDKKQFKGFGFWLYCGLGGSGKTLSMVEYLTRMKKRYPRVKIFTNFNFKYADGRIESCPDGDSFRAGRRASRILAGCLAARHGDNQLVRRRRPLERLA